MKSKLFSMLSRILGGRRAIALVGGAAMIIAAPASAEPSRDRSSGGVLERTTRAVGAKTSAPRGPSAEPLQERGCTDDSPCAQPPVASQSDTRYVGATGRARIRVHRSEDKKARPPLKMDISFELGLHSVHDSDGAGVASLRLGSGRFGATVDAIHYVESSPAVNGSDRVYMTLWSLGARARLLSLGHTRLWLEAGLGGVSSNQFEPLTGLVLSTELEHRVHPEVKLRGAARYFAFNENMRASELRAGIGVYFLTLGYRSFAFQDTGEALHGPEFGLAFDF